MKYIFFFLLALGCIVSVAVFLSANERDGEGRTFTPAQWEERIRAVGSERAYKEFIDAFANSPFEQQHSGAHVFGALLYRVEGIDGMPTCDSSFAFGCYHAFFGEFIADRGTDAIGELAESCRTKFGDADTGCTHGIGHGIVENLGRERLTEAIALCQKTGQKDPLYGCSSGVFMEYNHSTIITKDGIRVDVRQPTEGDVHAPCYALVSEDARASCYFEIALWWRHLFGDDFKKIGNLCTTVPEKEMRPICFKGWGTTVAENVDYTVAGAKELCGLIENAEGVSWCQVGVALRFIGTGSHQKEAHELCDHLSGAPAQECASFVR